VQAETQAAKRRGAEELVREALGHDCTPWTSNGRTLLGPSVELAPDQPLPHWHNGEIRVGNQWLPATGRIETENQQRLREAYEQQRAAAADTVDSQLALGELVRQASPRRPGSGPSQPRDSTRTGPSAWRGNAWVRTPRRQLGSPSGSVARPAANQQTAAAMGKWQKKLDELCASLRRKAPPQTAAVIERLKSELTPDAVPALEIRWGNDSEPAAHLGVQLLGTLSSHEGRRRTGRLAVLSPWPWCETRRRSNSSRGRAITTCPCCWRSCPRRSSRRLRRRWSTAGLSTVMSSCGRPRNAARPPSWTR